MKYILLCFILILTFATKGIMTLQATNESMDCYIKHYSFALVMVQSDINNLTRIFHYFKQANISSDFLIHFNSLNQMNNILDALPINLYGMIWVYVFATTKQTSGCMGLKYFIQTIKNRGKKVGILSAPYDWQAAIGNNNCLELGQLPLIYASKKNNSDFNDFIPFAGWKYPSMKQYAQLTFRCPGLAGELWYA